MGKGRKLSPEDPLAVACSGAEPNGECSCDVMVEASLMDGRCPPQASFMVEASVVDGRRPPRACVIAGKDDGGQDEVSGVCLYNACPPA